MRTFSVIAISVSSCILIGLFLIGEFTTDDSDFFFDDEDSIRFRRRATTAGTAPPKKLGARPRKGRKSMARFLSNYNDPKLTITKSHRSTPPGSFEQRRSVQQSTSSSLIPSMTSAAMDSSSAKATVKSSEIPVMMHAVTGGYPRTATTFQFNVVCACLFLHIQTNRPDLAKNMECSFSGSKVNREDFTSDKPQVIKSHKMLGDVDSKTTFAFTTAKTKEEAEETKASLVKDGYNVGLIQDLETLAELDGGGMAELYANVYNLSSAQTQDLIKYFAHWEILRTCCGKQMSKYWRNELFPSEKKNKEMKPHPTCSKHDIDQVEQEFMETGLYEAMDNHSKLKVMNKPSLVDGYLDGTYCSRYNELVRTKGVDFNEGSVA